MVRDLVGEALGKACAVCDTMLEHAPRYDAGPVWDAIGDLARWGEEATGRRNGFGPATAVREAGLLRGDDARLELLRAALDVCAQMEMVRSASLGEYTRDMTECGRRLEHYRLVRSAAGTT